MYRVQEIFDEGRARLSCVETPDLDAKVLLLHAASLSEAEFLSSPEMELNPAQARRYRRLLRRRLKGAPAATLVGIKEFWSLPFRINRGVLTPRPESELIVECVLELNGGKVSIVDVGTGSGNLAVSLGHELPEARIVAIDRSRRALKTARMNASLLGVQNIEFLKGRLFEPLSRSGWGRTCDYIVSNPPYVGSGEWRSLPSAVRKFEPRIALVSGEEGFEIISRLVEESPGFLKPKGYLVFEIGYGQKERALSLFGTSWDEVTCRDDLAGIPRVVCARLG